MEKSWLKSTFSFFLGIGEEVEKKVFFRFFRETKESPNELSFWDILDTGVTIWVPETVRIAEFLTF